MSGKFHPSLPGTVQAAMLLSSRASLWLQRAGDGGWFFARKHRFMTCLLLRTTLQSLACWAWTDPTAEGPRRLRGGLWRWRHTTASGREMPTACLCQSRGARPSPSLQFPHGNSGQVCCVDVSFASRLSVGNVSLRQCHGFASLSLSPCMHADARSRSCNCICLELDFDALPVVS
jgi:hypothetical protein